jgi:chemotaxis signal transduction protein
MSDNAFGCYVLLPCSSERSWVVPQRCLGEIVTVPSSEEQPPAEISWRGQLVPVIDFGSGDTLPWRDHRGGAGLVAVVLGRRDEACKYFGVAVRGGALGVSELPEDDIEDLPTTESDFITAAFRMDGNIYQVPDLLALQRAISAGDLVIQ